MGLKQTDLGGVDVLDVYFNSGGFSVELFTDSNPILDSDGGGGTRTLAAGGGYVEKDLDVVANATSIVAGIPIIEWEDIMWTFTGPLTGGVSLKGYMVMRGTTVIFQELFPAPFTPANNGDTWTVSLAYKLGNGTPT